jgi:hypothetical protein
LLYVNKETADYTQRILSIGGAEAVKPIKKNQARKRKAILEYYDDNNKLQKVLRH